MVRSPRPRRTPADFFQAALAVLGESGSQALTIATLCARVRVTKGSFYHHFDGMPGFVDDLLLFWEREYSERLIRISRSERDPSARLYALAELGGSLPHAAESAIRAWGRSSPDVAEVVTRVDRRRERHVVEAIVALGVDRTRARLLGRIAIDLLVGIQTREVTPEPRRVRQMLEEIIR
jgi:AcrR family transcriptional regulator